MKQRELVMRIAGFILPTLFLAGCMICQTAPTSTRTDTPRPEDRPTPVSTPIRTRAPTPRNRPSPTNTPTMACTGWRCTIRGTVYANVAASGNELGGASVKLSQCSNCSPTKGQHQTTSGPDGTFEFSDVYFHDTDRVRIEVAYEGYELGLWDSVGLYCLYCNCFGQPIEIVLHPASS